jgi:hypothetical protein
MAHTPGNLSEDSSIPGSHDVQKADYDILEDEQAKAELPQFQLKACGLVFARAADETRTALPVPID